MPVSHDVRDQLEKLDEQIFDLLAQRVSLYQQAIEEDEEAVGPEYDADVVAEWEGAADERGWNLTTAGNICRWVLKLCKSSGD